MKRILLSLILVFSSASVAFSLCGVATPFEDRITIEKEYHDADSVFLGETLRVEFHEEKDEIRIVFHPEKVFKGKYSPEISIVQDGCFHWPKRLRSSPSPVPGTKEFCPADGNRSYDAGGKYLIYAFENKGELRVLDCSRSALLGDYEPDLEVLDSIVNDPDWKFDKNKWEEIKNELQEKGRKMNEKRWGTPFAN